MRRFLMLASCCLALLPVWSQAQEAAELALPGQSDVRIVVDISGSMKENDPDNLRRPAVRLLARMLPDGASAGLWTFGQYVNMLVPHREVTDQWREQMVARSEQINSVALRTNLGEAIDVASDAYYSEGTLKNTHFIILTDGKVDVSDTPSANAAEEKRILETLLPRLVEQGATLYPVALSEQADTEFLGQLAADSGGHFQVAQNATELNFAFLTALNAAVPQEQIPLKGNAFTVDQGVEEFTALVFWGAQETRETRTLELVRPDGQTYTLERAAGNMRWAREAGYDLMTVAEPMAGEWRINGELGNGSRVTVVSDLKMVVSPVPARFSAESPISLKIAFFEEGEKVTNPEFLQVLDVQLKITAEDGRSGTKTLSEGAVPEDGVFTDEIGQLPVSGQYLMEVHADGKTFGRKFSATAVFDAAVDGGAAEQAGRAAPVKQEEGNAIEEIVSAPKEPEVAPAPVIENPIDTSMAEQPRVVDTAPLGEMSASNQKAELTRPNWWIAAGLGGLAALVVGLLAVKTHRSRKAALARAAAERETVDDLQSGSPERDSNHAEESFGMADFDLSDFDDFPEQNRTSTPTGDVTEEPAESEKK
ncbi:VWA domain-containing protein [Marinobacter salinisoli]|uniref:VWA domain-containing protein n=1 Tax=Marinobacter salinisoli TaxID=2769486 RepID=A0ABX7MQL7_9GAMM|nr:vWA domain-containing protein [Marinobacter salinisoli]QSP93710.1 VWA domain-containing protein [Marinobacter salinisoli]